MAEPTRAQREAMTASYRAFLHNTSLAMLVAAPTLMALPPRKLDLYGLALAGSFVASANYLTQERTGRGLLGNIPSSHRQPTGPQGQRTTTTAAAAAAAAAAQGSAEMGRGEKKEPRSRLREEPMSSSSTTSALEAAAKELWVAREAEGWKERRLRDKHDKIAHGEGYGSMILDQIWEVWNWGENKADDVKEENKPVLDQSQQERVGRRGGVSDNG
jgi:hypothetical protein